jgi:hypothetical protein
MLVIVCMCAHTYAHKRHVWYRRWLPSSYSGTSIYKVRNNDSAGPKTTGLDPDDQEGRSDSETLSELNKQEEEVPRTKLVLCWICVLSMIQVESWTWTTTTLVQVRCTSWKKVYIRGHAEQTGAVFHLQCNTVEWKQQSGPRNAQNGVGQKTWYCCYGGLMATGSFSDGGWNGSKWGNQKNRQTRKKGTSSNLHQTIQQRNASSGPACGRHFQLASRHGFKKVLRQNYSWVGGYGIGECLHSL